MSVISTTASVNQWYPARSFSKTHQWEIKKLVNYQEISKVVISVISSIMAYHQCHAISDIDKSVVSVISIKWVTTKIRISVKQSNMSKYASRSVIWVDL